MCVNVYLQILDKYEDLKLGELHGMDAKKVRVVEKGKTVLEVAGPVFIFTSLSSEEHESIYVLIRYFSCISHSTVVATATQGTRLLVQ